MRQQDDKQHSRRNHRTEQASQKPRQQARANPARASRSAIARETNQAQIDNQADKEAYTPQQKRQHRFDKSEDKTEKQSIL